MVSVVQQYLKKGAQIYVEGQIATRKWKDEQSGQDKYSTEIVIQGYNSSLTMLGGGNTGSGGIQNDNTQSSANNIEDSHLKLQTIWMTRFHFSLYAKTEKFLKIKTYQTYFNA